MNTLRKIFRGLLVAWALGIIGYYLYNYHVELISPQYQNLANALTPFSVKYKLGVYGFLLFFILLFAWLKRKSTIRLKPIYFIIWGWVMSIFTLMLGHVLGKMGYYKSGTIILDNEGLPRPYIPGEVIDPAQIYIEQHKIYTRVKYFMGEFWTTFKEGFEVVNFWDGLISTIGHVTLHLGAITFILLCLYSWGGAIVNRLDLKKIDDEERILFSIGIGTMVVSILLMLMSLFGGVTAVPVFIVLGFGFILSMDNIIRMGEWLVKDVTPPLNKIRWGNWLAGLGIGLFIVLSFFETSVPVPSAFDDYVLYMNLPNLLAQSGEFIHGQSMHAFAFIQVIGLLVFHQASLTLLTVATFGFLAFGAIYKLLSKFNDSTKAMFFTLVAVTTPFIFFHNYVSLKVELPILFYSVLALLSFYFFTKEKKEPWKYLLLVGLFAGFGLSIKISSMLIVAILMFMIFHHYFNRWGVLIGLMLTLAFYGVVGPLIMGGSLVFYFQFTYWFSSAAFILALILIYFEREANKKNIIKRLKQFIFSMLIVSMGLMIPLAPWFVVNAFDSGGDISFNSLIKSQNSPAQRISYDEIGFENVEACTGKESESEMTEYQTKRANEFRKVAFLPWDLTFKIPQTKGGWILNIGPFLLALLPLLFFRGKPKGENERMFILAALSSLVLWVLIVPAIAWFAMSIFALWVVALASSLEGFKKSRISHILIQIMIILMVVTYVNTRIQFASDRFIIPTGYATGLLDRDLVIKNKFHDYPPLLNIINENPNDKILLLNKEFLFFFIENNFERTYRDRFFFTIDCLYSEDDDEKLLNYLRKMEVKYIISPILKDRDIPVDFKLIRKNYPRFVEFGKAHLKSYNVSRDTYLFEVPYE